VLEIFLPDRPTIYIFERLLIESYPMLANKPTDIKIITNILLAEDDIDDQNIFQIALQEIDSSIQTQFVSNGRELLTLLQSYKPDLLFLDLDMPYKNGLESLIEIRNNPVLEELPVIVFSSTTKPSNIQTAYEMGAHLFFIKPPIYSDYLSSIKAIFKLNWDAPDAVKEQYCVNGRYTAFS
jgi:CheY-like chemotaxis protein